MDQIAFLTAPITAYVYLDHCTCHLHCKWDGVWRGMYLKMKLLINVTGVGYQEDDLSPEKEVSKWSLKRKRTGGEQMAFLYQ